MLVHETASGVTTQEVHFTFDDLSKTRIITTLGAAPETFFALDLLSQNTNDSFTAWRKEAKKRLGKNLNDLLAVAKELSPISDLISLTQTGPEQIRIALTPEGIKKPRSRYLQQYVHDLYDTALRPHWPKIHSYLETERETTGRILFTAGYDRLFATMHRQIHWDAPVLRLPQSSPGQPTTVHLNGTGIVIVPSLFLYGQPRLFRTGADTAKPPILVYPVRPNAVSAAVLWASSPAAQSLSALVGNTRAAVLRSLNDSRTTTHIAEQVGISPGSASQHATVLRNAGLITTHRTRTAAIHSLTPLGRALFKERWGIPK
jgi:Helix-turn-helix domain